MKVKYTHHSEPEKEKIYDTEKAYKMTPFLFKPPTQEEFDKSQIDIFERDLKKGIVLSYQIIEEGMTREQKIELCRMYNNSDIDAFCYMEPFCNPLQKELLGRLVSLNTETDIGCGREPATSEEETEYVQSKMELLKSFGLECKNGDCYFEGEFYI